jgi:hypothetical protein
MAWLSAHAIMILIAVREPCRFTAGRRPGPLSLQFQQRGLDPSVIVIRDLRKLRNSSFK